MSTSLVKNEILRFLSSDKPETLCIKGRWGVGKTFSWKQYLQDAAEISKGIALERYAYVSLFGMNSLDELKYSIFEATVKKDQANRSASLQTLKSSMDSVEKLGRKYAWAINLIPGSKNYLGAAAPAFFMSVRSQIVCIDDLERKGSKLDAADVLGLISFLKEERSCKVVLLLNDEALEVPDREKFDKYLEKVIDVSLAFAPSSSECVDIALPNRDAVSIRVSELCIKLGIKNIRVIRKIESAIRSIKLILEEFDEEVFTQAASSLALFGWSHFQPEEAPTLEFLTTKKAKDVYGLQYNLNNQENIDPKEAAWNALLQAYGYVWTDEFDLVLIDGTKNGYFDPEIVKIHAKVLHDGAVATKADGSFQKAWDIYHDSFADNQEQVLDTVHASFMKNFKYISPMNLNGTVSLFKELGRNNQASKMIKHYIEHRDEERKFFNLEEYPFSSSVTDQEVIEAFRAKCASMEDKRDIPKLLQGLKDNWTEESLLTLSAASVDEFYKSFKEATGNDLSKRIASALQFDNVANASDTMKEISKRAKQALRRIASESPINARRVAKYGIKLEQNPREATAAVK